MLGESPQRSSSIFRYLAKMSSALALAYPPPRQRMRVESMFHEVSGLTVLACLL